MFKNIIVPLDGSAIAECVLPHLVSLVRTYDPQITLLRVLECPATSPASQPVDPLEWEMCKAEAETYLEEVAQRLRQEQGIEALFALLEGHPAERIIEYAQENEADLILVSSHGDSGLSRWNVSSVVRKIIQRANRSIFLVRAYSPDPSRLVESRYERLLVPLDGSQRAECALTTAVTLARSHKARLILSHVVVEPEMPRQMPRSQADQELREQFVARNREAANAYLEKVRERLSHPFETRLLVSSDPAESLHVLTEDEDISLAIVSAHGYAGKARWPYGSVTTTFIEYGNTPLLVIQDLDPEDIQPTQAEEAAREQKGH